MIVVMRRSRKIFADTRRPNSAMQAAIRYRFDKTAMISDETNGIGR